MSILNPYAFTPFGQPAAPTVSALRAIGAPASVAQLAAARKVFGSFCAQTRLSAAPNQTAIGRLPDGTRYRIVVVGAMTTMTMWPVAPSGYTELQSGIWFRAEEGPAAGTENRSRIYTVQIPARGKLLVNRKKKGGGSSSVWALVPFPDPFFAPTERHFRPAIPLTEKKGWEYTYLGDMGQFGRTASVEQGSGSDSRVEPTAVIGSDAVELFVDIAFDATGHLLGVNSRVWKGAFDYAVPQEPSKAVDVLPGSFSSPAESRVHTFTDPASLSVDGSATIRSSIDNKYVAFGVLRETVLGDEVLDYRTPGNTFDYMLLDVLGTTAQVTLQFTSRTTAQIYTSAGSFYYSGEADGKRRRYSPEVYVFKVAESGYVFDHVENYTPEVEERYTPALSVQKNLFTGNYDLRSYTREVLRYIYPSNVGGPKVGPVDIEVRADYSGEDPKFVGVDAAGRGQYMRESYDTEYYSKIVGYISASGTVSGTGTGTYKSNARTKIFGLELAAANNEVTATATYGAGGAHITYESSSETRHISYTIPEIELLVYVHQKGTYTHASEKKKTLDEVIRSPATNAPVFHERRVVIQCKGVQIFIDAPPAQNEEDPYRSVRYYPGLGLIAALGDVKVDGFEIKTPDWSGTAYGDADPLYPFGGTLVSLGGKRYSTSAGGFVHIPGLSPFAIAISHCFVPETGGVCLHISVPPESAATARQTYYFLYDDEAGLREMPVKMQDAILGSLQLPPATWPPTDHMVQI